MAKQPKLALIDSHALIHRAYHALPPMTTRQGIPTNAAYGFTAMLLKMFATVKPTHVIAAFDVKGPTFRSEKFAAYKAQRAPAAEDLIAQFAVVRRVVAAFRIPIIDKVGFEADDIIGTLVHKIDGNVRKVIVTGDQDTFQLIDDLTTVFTLKRGVTDTVVYDEAMVRERFGFGPALIADYKGLRGDPSDNIPGVKGIGEKTAKELVSTYGSIEDIFAHLDTLPDRLQKKLQGRQEEALFSRELAQIKCDVPISFTLQDAELDDFDPAEVQRVFEELEFKSLLQRIPLAREQQATLFSSGAATAGKPLPENYHLVTEKKAIKELKAKLLAAEIVACDTENDWLGARQHPIVGISFALREAAGTPIEAYYVPVTPETVKDFKDVYENPQIKKVGHNLKYDIEVLRQSGIVMQGIVFDSMIASYLLHSGARQHGLDTLAVQELGYHPIPITALIGEGSQQKRMSEVPLEELACYAAEDADVTLQLYEVLAPKIKAQGLTRVLEEVELPLIPVLVVMELAGVAVDLDVLSHLKTKVARRLKTLTTKIYSAAGGEFNINSTQQLREVLYTTLALPTVGIARTQSGFSTAATELEKLRGQHAIIELLEEYRELNKLQNTYIETLPKLVDPDTGRIYGSFNQTVAATGRLSSTDPNLQNIPVRTELGQEIRAAFIAQRGNRLVKCDYSQIELRLVAHMSRDEKMLDAFRAGQDIHRATAAWVYGITPDKVTDQQRREAKTLNFGVLYGMGAQSFARTAGISVEEARSFIGRYKEQYRGIAAFIETTVEMTRAQGYVETLFGRRREIPEINSRNPQIRSQAERIAFNFPLQGTAADIMKKAMIEVQKLIDDRFPEAKLVLTVHDELVAELPTEYAEDFAQAMRETMERVYTLDVPLVVDVAIGKNWRDTEKIKN